ncbi:MAG: hypothetical protein V1874_11790 [Spirochaetota bacterium]
MFNLLIISVIAGSLFLDVSKIENSNSSACKLSFSEKYYPLSVGNELYLNAYKKDNPSETIKLKVEVKNIETIEGENFYYLCAPKMDIRYLIKRDETGLYMKMIKYPFLFFGNINVQIKPPLNVFKFPAYAGLKWEQEAKAEASFMFFPVNKHIKAKFEIIEKQFINTNIGKIEAYLVQVMINHDSFKKNYIIEKFWYAKGIGYSRADTQTHFAEIAGYKIRDEETGLWDIRLPEKIDEYL